MIIGLHSKKCVLTLSDAINRYVNEIKLLLKLYFSFIIVSERNTQYIEWRNIVCN